MWRCTFGTAPRDGSVESQEWVDTLDRKVRAKRETSPWRGPAETCRRRRHWCKRKLKNKEEKKLGSTGGESDKRMRLSCALVPGGSGTPGVKRRINGG
jgi:hypothetical protein